MPEAYSIENEIYNQKGEYILGNRHKRLQNLRNAPLFKMDPVYNDFITQTKKALTELAIRITIRGNKLPPSIDDSDDTSLPNLTNQKRQAMSLMCRIYIGSINFTVNEDMLRNAFSTFGPVRNVNMSLDLTTNRHKGYAFLEFETPEAAYLALGQMDGVLLGGRPIKVGRPSNMPQADPLIKQLIEESKKYPRVYVSSIHPNLTEDEIKSLFEPFGEIKSISMPMNSNRQTAHLGYCFIEFTSMADADVAVNSMNLFSLMNLTLRVGKSVTPPFNELNNEALEARKQEALQMAQLINNKLSQSSQSMLYNSAMKLEFSSATLSSRSHSHSKKRDRSEERSSHKSRHRDDKHYSTSNHRSRDRISPRRSSPVTSDRHTSRDVKSSHDHDHVKNKKSPSIERIADINSHSSHDSNSSTGQNKSITNADANLQVKNMMDMSPEPKKPKDDCEMSPPRNSSIDNPRPNNSKDKIQTVQNGTEDLLKSEDAYTISGYEARQMHMHKLLRPLEQRVVVLSNLIDINELDDELKDSIQEECSRISEVKNFLTYLQENKDENSSEENIEKSVHFFIECSNNGEAKKLLEKMNGRYFSQRIVRARFYDQELYDQDYFRVYD